MRIVLLLIICFPLLFSCNSENSQTQPSVSSEEKKDTFFPVTSFIKGQFLHLDTIPITPLKIVTNKNKVDSSWIKREELRGYLNPFISDEISANKLEKYFAETKFKDLTLNTFTFTYDPKQPTPDSIKIAHWDVYINPETGNVSKIYIVKTWKEKEFEYTQQLTWQTNEWAKIVLIKSNPKKSTNEILDQTFVWDFN